MTQSASTILVGTGRLAPASPSGSAGPWSAAGCSTPKRRLAAEEVDAGAGPLPGGAGGLRRAAGRGPQEGGGLRRAGRRRAHRHHRHAPADAPRRDARRRGAAAHPRGAGQRRVGGQAGGAEDQERLPRGRGRVLQGAARRRGLRRRAASSRTCWDRPSTWRGRRRRGPSSWPTTSRRPTRRCCSTAAGWGPSSPTPGPRPRHTAIVARALEIPAVVGVGRHHRSARARRLAGGGRHPRRGAGQPLAGGAGRVRGGPRAAPAARSASCSGPATCRPSPRTAAASQLGGNIEFAEEVPSLLAHGAEAVGLYRTEFLFLGRADLPTEEEHYQNYRRDAGGDGAAAGDHPHLRPGRRQAPAGMRLHAEQPGAGAAGHPLLPAPPRACSAPSSGRCCGPRCTATSGSCSP